MQLPDAHRDQPPVLRLWHSSPLASPYTWSVITAARSHVVRRTLDLEVTPPGALGPEVSEAALPPADFKTIMGELERISICPAASSELVLDAGMYGVEIGRYPSPVVLAWAGSPPVGWEGLAAWHHRTRHRLNRLLPPASGLGYEYQTGRGLTFDE
ncbi:hypothetical protein RA210_U10368 [Rubrivivax sp. A210]|uniref:hypothetical protein n=1 Tax=Rubrivivax sp. A210 TaxID=2772301 RepID=UPI001918F979|nr:hypothetical protein [Rubrivivax sp. A210]CAD5366524.1 hypothetical protein RA210_U10368 [Rubrivivax sp. A210]